ncbi:hypothetical protein STENM327S_08742 [Streptomyces tendae]
MSPGKLLISLRPVPSHEPDDISVQKPVELSPPAVS